MKMRTRGLDILLGGLVALQFAAPAMGQGAADDDAQLEEIVVTGSRIKRTELESNSPAVAIDKDYFQLDAETNVVRQLQRLPAFQPGRSPNSGQGSSFTGSFIDLRGLDRKRTLVLVNGKRWINTISDGGVDLSTIPLELIERVDVVTGGGSAAYGSDAIAGVVNFILVDSFDGLELNAQTGYTGEGETSNTRISLTGGKEFDDGLGSAYFHAALDETEELTGEDRSYLNPALANVGGQLVPNNSTVVPSGSALVNGTRAAFTGNGELFTAPGTPNTLMQSELFNNGPYARVQFPADKKMFAGGLDYNISDRVKFFANGIYVRDEITVETEPADLNVENVDIPVTNPFIGPITQGYLATLDGDSDGFVQIPGLSRRLTELGPITRFNTRDSYRVAAGVEIDLKDTWYLEVFGTYAESNFDIHFVGRLSNSRVAQALDVVMGPDGPECRNPTFEGLQCVPLNIFGQGGITQAMDDFTNVDGGLTGFNTESDVQAILSGEPVSLPAGPLGVAFGLERRFAQAGERPKEVWRTGETGPVLADFVSSIEHREVFAEAIVPLVANAPVADYLGLELGVRYTQLDPGDNETTYKGLVNWSITDQVKLRGGVQHAIRAPNFFELGAGDQVFDPLSLLVGSDPCFTGTPLTGDVRASCIADGVPASVADTGATLPGAQQFFFRFFGNENLKAETSDSFSAGVVFDNLFVDNLNFTADYWTITVEDSIGSAPLSVLFGQCYLAGTGGTDPFCGEIDRDPATGLVTALNAGFQNLGELDVEGIDFTANYLVNLGGVFEADSTLVLDFVATHLLSKETLPFAEDPSGRFDCAGLYGPINCGSPDPEWKAQTRATWDDGPLSVALNWTWIGEVTNDATVFDQTLVSELAKTEIGAQHYFDLAATWSFEEFWELRFGINNLFDEAPPVIGVDMGTPSGDNNTYPGLYDAVGRRYFAGVRVHF